MVRLDYEIYNSRQEALRAETLAIETEHPLYNKQKSIRRSRPVPLPWPRALTEAELDRCAIAAYRGRSYLEWIFSEDGIAG